MQLNNNGMMPNGSPVGMDGQGQGNNGSAAAMMNGIVPTGNAGGVVENPAGVSTPTNSVEAPSPVTCTPNAGLVEAEMETTTSNTPQDNGNGNNAGATENAAQNAEPETPDNEPEVI